MMAMNSILWVIGTFIRRAFFRRHLVILSRNIFVFKDIAAAKKRHPAFRQWCRKRGIRSIPAVTLGFQDRKKDLVLLFSQ
jgi:hypothetical protein